MQDVMRQIRYLVRDGWVTATILALLALLVHDAVNPSTILLVIAIGVGYSMAFTINDYYDVPIDALCPTKARRNFFVLHAVPQRTVVLAAAGVLTFLILSFAQYGLTGLGVLSVCLAVMFGYSAPPLRLKSRPGWDVITHGLFMETWPYLVCLILIKSRWTSLDTLMTSVAFLSSVAAQLDQQLRDYRLDFRADYNFTVRYGVQVSTRLMVSATVFGCLIFVLGTVFGIVPKFFLPYFLIVLPTVIYRLTHQINGNARSDRLVRLSFISALLYTCILLGYLTLR